MKIYGEEKRTNCPICNSTRIENKWKIPLVRLPVELLTRKHKLKYASSWDSPVEFHFSRCLDCTSIFTDPFTKYERDKMASYIIKEIDGKLNWTMYKHRYDLIMKYLSPIKNHDLLLDAACGGGQMMRIMKEKGIPWKRMVGIDVNPYGPAKLKEMGFETYRGSVCEPIPQIKDGTVDLCIFAEASEHVNSVYQTIEVLSAKLKPGAGFYMTAQAIGGDLFINPYEFIGTTKEAITGTLNKFGIDVVHVIPKERSCGRFVFFGRKTCA